MFVKALADDGGHPDGVLVCKEGQARNDGFRVVREQVELLLEVAAERVGVVRDVGRRPQLALFQGRGRGRGGARWGWRHGIMRLLLGDCRQWRLGVRCGPAMVRGGAGVLMRVAVRGRVRVRRLLRLLRWLWWLLVVRSGRRCAVRRRSRVRMRRRPRRRGRVAGRGCARARARAGSAVAGGAIVGGRRRIVPVPAHGRVLRAAGGC